MNRCRKRRGPWIRAPGSGRSRGTCGRRTRRCRPRTGRRQAIAGPCCAGISQATVNHLRVRVGFVHGGDERLEQPAVLLGIAPGVPVADVLLVPQRAVMNAAAEVVHHPIHVAGEGVDLLGRLGRPEDGVETAVVVVERLPGSGVTESGNLPAGDVYIGLP